MCDPTFTRQFAMATQADILRRAERDGRHGNEWVLDDPCRVARQRRPILQMVARLRRVLWSGTLGGGAGMFEP